MPEITQWIRFIDTGLYPGAPWLNDDEDRENFITEQIDKLERRSCIDSGTATRLFKHYGLAV